MICGDGNVGNEHGDGVVIVMVMVIAIVIVVVMLMVVVGGVLMTNLKHRF